MRYLQLPIAILAALITTAPAAATPLYKTGHISQLFLSAPYNYAFRIYLNSGLSGCGGNFAYMNADLGNYQAYVSALITAYSTNKTIDLTYSVDTGGTCAILEFGVR
jgi:hypothetical protein